jgi:hypothetical protein
MPIELRSIKRLLVDDGGASARYWIPAYQRGYRWAHLQVTQLLNDIWDFIQSGAGNFYCLQPIVVRRMDDGRFEVVDGQQRLTTLHILLSHQREILRILRMSRFSIAYETRDPAFLEGIDPERAGENADFHHICEALRAIDVWMAQHDGTQPLTLIQHLLAEDSARESNVRVIWYELDPSDDAVAAFTRLNVGKIPLTEAELVRALFLRRARQDDGADRTAYRISYEWDQIEKRLRNDAVWYFLQDKPEGTANRISLIFRLAALRAGRLNAQDHAVFAYFSDRLGETDAEGAWREAREIFMALEEWYDDRELFHIVGFILQQAQGDLDVITELLDQSSKLSKQAFSEFLRRRVLNDIFRKVAENLPADELGQEIDAQCRAVDYSSPGKVRSLLLLFNLATLIENQKSNIRFQFDSFKTERWDIEHIRAVSDDRPERDNEQKAWLRQCRDYLRAFPDGPEQALALRIDAYLDPENHPVGAALDFETIDTEILTHFDGSRQATDHTLANLTLLDRGTNRGYGNAVFAMKREILLDQDRSGVFVPLCTRNVFLKSYSRIVGNVLFWSEDDAEAYLDAIVATLTGFFGQLEAPIQ